MTADVPGGGPGYSEPSPELMPQLGTLPPIIAPAYFQTYTQGALAPVRWRLLSGNHRDMGRGQRDYPDDDSCRRAISELIAMVGHLQPKLVAASGRRWEWRLTLDDDVVARSGHSFDRRSRCEQACALFVTLVPTAVHRGELRVWSNRRRPAFGGASLLQPRSSRPRWARPGHIRSGTGPLLPPDSFEPPLADGTDDAAR